ncbi:MAG: YjbQ family protein [Candidatus Aenigmarchaeota archaeon]|nr:YjbQ family protein [Candidatus Aenigmarchaeota archaeon]
MLYRDVLEYKTKTQEKRDITKDVQELVDKYGVKDGLCNIFIQSTTAGLMINEDDRMLMADIEKLLNQLAPAERLYQHPENAHSHIRAAIFKNNLNIPIADGKLLLGTWQNIMLWEFDVKERTRTVVVTIIGG